MERLALLPSGWEAGFFLVSLSSPLSSNRYGGLADIDARTGSEADLRGWWMGRERLVLGRLLDMGSPTGLTCQSLDLVPNRL